MAYEPNARHPPPQAHGLERIEPVSPGGIRSATWHALQDTCGQTGFCSAVAIAAKERRRAQWPSLGRTGIRLLPSAAGIGSRGEDPGIKPRTVRRSMGFDPRRQKCIGYGKKHARGKDPGKILALHRVVSKAKANGRSAAKSADPQTVFVYLSKRGTATFVTDGERVSPCNSRRRGRFVPRSCRQRD
jgi:hypothetical protein